MFRRLKAQSLRKRHGWRGLLLLVVIGVVAVWTLSRLEPPRFDGTRVSKRIFPKGGRALSRLSTAAVTGKTVRVNDAVRLLLATHNRLLWYTPSTGKVDVVHEGQGVYYGTFRAQAEHEELRSVWVVSRPHNWHPASTEEALLHIDLDTGALIEKKIIPSRFTHDAVRVGDTVWVCDTGEGKILRLSYPSMDLERSYDLFTVREHINTLAVLDSDSLWVVLHNLGSSQVAQVNTEDGTITRRLTQVGNNAHGLVAWRGRFVMLSSKETALILLDPSTGHVDYIWQGDNGFLKGLAVVDDVAYFGISPPMERQDRDGPRVNCALVAVDLQSKRLLLRREVETHGLLNIVAAPQLGLRSTSVALPSGAGAVDALSLAAAGKRDEGAGGAGGVWASSWLVRPVPLGSTTGAWATGMPYMSLARKGGLTRHVHERSGTDFHAYSRTHGGMSHVSIDADPGDTEQRAPTYVHLGMVPDTLMRPLQDRLSGMPQEWWKPDVQHKVSADISDREANLAAVKPGVNTMFLLFSTRNADRIWQLPLYDYFQESMEPILDATIGPDAKRNIVRLQLAQMTPGAHIKPHKDQGPWAVGSHRIHFVVKTNPNVSFFSCPECPSNRALADPRCQPPPQGTCDGVEAAQNSIFEIDNLIIHSVTNTASVDRVHLVVDVAERPTAPPVKLSQGQRCPYVPTAEQATANGC